MKTVHRWWLYFVTGIAVLFLLALISKNQINIPVFIAIPLVVIAFWSASKHSEHTNSKGDMGGTTGEPGSTGGEDE